MLKELVYFINIVFLIIAPILSVFGMSVVFKAVFGDVNEIKEMDQEKICLKK